MIHVGCCARRVPWQEYATLFDAIEVDSTFYRLPRVETARRWYESTGGRVRFCIKAFQGITHPVSSPTWRRAGSQRPKGNAERYGSMKPTEENFACWDATLEVCRAVNARICLIQLPPSFVCTDENVSNAVAFLSSIRRDGMLVGLEFRHRSWMAEENRGIVLNLLDRGSAVHVVDPLTCMPLSMGDTLYFRLHGRLLSSSRGSMVYDYSHRYSDDELTRLREIMDDLAGYEVFVMFNNVSMHDDALRFRHMLD